MIEIIGLFVIAVIAAAFLSLYVWAEVLHYRKGNDVWQWAANLSRWLHERR